MLRPHMQADRHPLTVTILSGMLQTDYWHNMHHDSTQNNLFCANLIRALLHAVLAFTHSGAREL